MTFNHILDKYRKLSHSERDKGDRFERLMQGFLMTDPTYATQFKKVWLWNEFPGRKDLGGSDTGIDLVALTHAGDFWAIQCKCVAADSVVDKRAVDSFLATSGRSFKDENHQTATFAHCLWISTSAKPWGSNANEAILNQNPPVQRIGLPYLAEAPVDWDKLDKGLSGEASRSTKFGPRDHQKIALAATRTCFEAADRGKLIMACGTGKTLTALWIAEQETQGKGLILFLVPSIALLGQTLREWTANAKEPINAICICSDPKITKKNNKDADTDLTSVVDLALPASTDVKSIVKQFQLLKATAAKGMTVVFSTYQSIEVIAEAQKELAKQSRLPTLASDAGEDSQSRLPTLAKDAGEGWQTGLSATDAGEGWQTGLGTFDLIICDEAHRTTGVTLSGGDESAFVKVHDNAFLQAKKRLYMTATPRLFHADAKDKAAQADATLCSMDDPKLYGEEIYRIGFGEAVSKGLLTDYKVLVLTMSEKDIPVAVQKALTDEEGTIKTDDLSKLIGCINALSKHVIGDDGMIRNTDPQPMRRAVAFCATIANSQKITTTFNQTSTTYINDLPAHERDDMVSVNAQHIDGSMNAPARDELLSWLKDADAPLDECRVLTNVRCLSEGVDVPSLDAVMFLSARNSQVDVVQSVGRVMRLSPGKKYGYIIIPVVIPADVEPDKALDDNERFKVVWSVLNALRAHDDRFNATVNKIELNKHKPANINVVGVRGPVEHEYPGSGQRSKDGSFGASEVEQAPWGRAATRMSEQMQIQFEQLQHLMFARMVQKVGSRAYWEQWARSVADIAERQGLRITQLVADDKTHQKAFAAFLKGLQKNINPSITAAEAVEMLSQHIITKPVFEALFEGYSFVKNNPISMSMQAMLDLLEEQALASDAETLEKFYESVRMRAAGIDNAEGKQRIIVELYDKFFKTAFPKMVEKLGIVYTPVEVVDFIVHSVEHILQKEFGRSMGDENVHILDPFTGTGTFITRLLQSEIIAAEDLPRKYGHEIHANEIVLLAYYIAAINIENAYHDALGLDYYAPFEGICLTDTFQLGEADGSETLLKDMFPQNSARVKQQRKAPLRVIMGNPPYSVGQNSANDNAQNQSYERLNGRIAATYAKETDATNKNSLYDSYIKAIRWSTDRLDPQNGGIVCFVSNGSWIDGNAQSGLRKCLEKEFSSIYVFNLRGNARTQGELRRKEAGNVFGAGSRTPISITLLVKKGNEKEQKAVIEYHDIGDYLNREEKLDIVKKFGSMANAEMKWLQLKPNEHGDWLNQRDDLFGQFISQGSEDKFDAKSTTFFITHSCGVQTNRDAWVYGFAKPKLTENLERFVEFYNRQLATYRGNQVSKVAVEDFIEMDERMIKWSSSLIQTFSRGQALKFDGKSLVKSVYRPFVKQWLYFDKYLNHRPYQMPKVFPNGSVQNLLICVPGVGVTKDFSALITDTIPDLELIGKSQCFPLYYYEERTKTAPTLFDKKGDEGEYIRRDGVSDWILGQAHKAYGKSVTKEDIFYYVYGFLHSPGYRAAFANDLKKMLPRLPLVEEPKDFWKFSKAGRALAELHIGYEKVEACNEVTVIGAERGDYRVEKMKPLKKGDKGTIIYNNHIRLENIPARAYDYIVNGKSAIEWIMERYAVTTHKESGIKNDPNDWAAEVGNPRYILDLLLSVIEVSVRTVEIVDGLPGFGGEGAGNQ